jgi:hypothetical protein
LVAVAGLAVLGDAENPHPGGVHDLHEKSGIPGVVAGVVSLSSARYLLAPGPTDQLTAAMRHQLDRTPPRPPILSQVRWLSSGDYYGGDLLRPGTLTAARRCGRVV